MEIFTNDEVTDQKTAVRAQIHRILGESKVVKYTDTQMYRFGLIESFPVTVYFSTLPLTGFKLKDVQDPDDITTISQCTTTFDLTARDKLFLYIYSETEGFILVETFE